MDGIWKVFGVVFLAGFLLALVIFELIPFIFHHLSIGWR